MVTFCAILGDATVNINACPQACNNKHVVSLMLIVDCGISYIDIPIIPINICSILWHCPCTWPKTGICTTALLRR